MQTAVISSNMNPPPVLRAPSTNRFFVILAILVGLAGLMVGLTAYGVTSFFRMSRPTSALRDSLVNVAGNQWDRKFQFNVGSWTLGLARAGLGFVQLDPEARAAVGA